MNIKAILVLAILLVARGSFAGQGGLPFMDGFKNFSWASKLDAIKNTAGCTILELDIDPKTKKSATAKESLTMFCNENSFLHSMAQYNFSFVDEKLEKVFITIFTNAKYFESFKPNYPSDTYVQSDQFNRGSTKYVRVVSPNYFLLKEKFGSKMKYSTEVDIETYLSKRVNRIDDVLKDLWLSEFAKIKSGETEAFAPYSWVQKSTKSKGKTTYIRKDFGNYVSVEIDRQ